MDHIHQLAIYDQKSAEIVDLWQNLDEETISEVDKFLLDMDDIHCMQIQYVILLARYAIATIQKNLLESEASE